jgi:hypothetical protein
MLGIRGMLGPHDAIVRRLRPSGRRGERRQHGRRRKQQELEEKEEEEEESGQAPDVSFSHTTPYFQRK